MTKTKKLRKLLSSNKLSFLMGAHNALSAQVVEETGFRGIWAGGLSISAQLGVRDSNEASWTQIIDIVEFMNDAVSIPILLDGDTGYGNFNNVRRLVKKLGTRGIAGVCIEDKLFPKTNSFINGEKQPLADIDEFCGRIHAAKDSQEDPDFCVVARVEALIAGWGMDAALERAHRYTDAGADAILIHSKRSDGSEIFEFARKWKSRIPLVIVPTQYYRVPADEYRRAGIRTVIWANHLLRSSIAAMRQTAKTIMEDEGLLRVEKIITPMREIFKLQGAEELAEAEKKYLSSPGGRKKAIILAASRGKELTQLTAHVPKCMLMVEGKPILERQVESLRKSGVQEIDVVAGYCSEKVQVPGAEVLLNRDYETSDELASLGVAVGRLSQTTLVSYGDLLFRQYILNNLMEHKGEIVIVVDSSNAGLQKSAGEDRVVCSSRDERNVLPEAVTLQSFKFDASGESHGSWIGLVKLSGDGNSWFQAAHNRLKLRKDYCRMSVPHLLQEIVSIGHEIQVMYISGHWVNVNRLPDVDRAKALLVDSES
jgi:phosphoenolpyruvate phosphomutase